MKQIKRILTFTLVLVMLVSTMLIPASALDSTWQYSFKQFQEISQENDSSYINYVKALQRFLMCHSGTASIVGSNAVDGDFGTKTLTAVISFKVSKGFSASAADIGVVTSATWGAIAQEIDYETSYGTASALFENGNRVIYVNTSNSASYQYRFYTSTGALGYVFHTE